MTDAGVDPHLLALLRAEFARLRERYTAQGLDRRSGFGVAPAIVAVDMTRGFLDPEAPGGVAELNEHIDEVRRILDAGRAAEVPVYLVTTAYDEDFTEGGAWARKVSHGGMFHGSPWVDFVDGIGRIPSDGVVVKHYASAFSGTDLAARLASRGVDTVIVVGVATSGCIRASVVDAVSSGFRVIVPHDAVADRNPVSAMANLFDIDMKYADVVPTDEVLAYLAGSDDGDRATTETLFA